MAIYLDYNASAPIDERVLERMVDVYRSHYGNADMLELSQDVGHRLRVHELMACGVQVSIRTNDLYGSQYQCKLPFRTQLPNEIAGAGFHLLMERYRWDKPIRAVTIRGIDLVSQKDAEQLSMFVDHQKRDRRILLEDAVEDIRRRFGKRAIS